MTLLLELKTLAAVNVTATDSATFTESVRNGLSLARADTLAFTDSRSLSASASGADLTALVELAKSASQLRVAEPVSLAEAVARAVSLARTDGATFTDTRSVAALARTADSASFGDSSSVEETSDRFLVASDGAAFIEAAVFQGPAARTFERVAMSEIVVITVLDYGGAGRVWRTGVSAVGSVRGGPLVRAGR